MVEVAYITREEIKSALDVQGTMRDDTTIDLEALASSRAIEGEVLRYFYPSVSTQTFDWPDHQYSAVWRLWLDQREMAGPPSQVLAAGVDITSSVMARPDDAPLRGRPFTKLEIDLSGSAAFNAGATFQRAISVTGPFGFCQTERAAGTLANGVNATDTAIDFGVPGYRGVGSIVRVDTERMIITDRNTADTGQTLGSGGLTASNAATTVPVTDTTQFAVGETITIDAESMLVQKTVGTYLVVKRAWDGSVLAAHAAGATIYANRLCTVVRGALGTTPATHTQGAAIAENDPPSLIRQLALAQSVVSLIQTRAGYPAPTGRKAPRGQTGDVTPTLVSDLDDLWGQVRTTYQRMRTRTAARMV